VGAVSLRRRHTRYPRVTGVQTCALPIYQMPDHDGARNVQALLCLAQSPIRAHMPHQIDDSGTEWESAEASHRTQCQIPASFCGQQKQQGLEDSTIRPVRHSRYDPDFRESLQCSIMTRPLQRRQVNGFAPLLQELPDESVEIRNPSDNAGQTCSCGSPETTPQGCLSKVPRQRIGNSMLSRCN